MFLDYELDELYCEEKELLEQLEQARQEKRACGIVFLDEKRCSHQ